MIKTWTVGRFKSIKEPETLHLKPLTVLTGPNSSGKSTLIQSILLVSQTLLSKVSRRQLVLNGDYIKLGTIEDVICEKTSEKTLVLGMLLDVDLARSRTKSVPAISQILYNSFMFGAVANRASITANFTFGPSEPAEGGRETKSLSLQAQLQTAEFGIELSTNDEEQNSLFADEDRPKNGFVIKKRTAAELGELRTSTSDALKFGSEKSLDDQLRYSISFEHRRYLRSLRRRRRRGYHETPNIIGVELEHFLPRGLINRYSVPERLVAQCLDDILEDTTKTNDLIAQWSEEGADPIRKAVASVLREISVESGGSLLDFLGSLTKARRVLGKPDDNDQTKEVFGRTNALLDETQRGRKSLEHYGLPDHIELLNAALVDELATLRYLGPLRDEPKPVYDISSSADPSDVGSRGEFTASVLDLYATTLVDFVDPSNPNAGVSQCELHEAVNRWLTHFSIAESYSTREESKLGHRLFIKSLGVSKFLDLTNVGVGVSQVLPIVVMSLVSEPGSVLLFEQPELHLHPKVQSLLADFFLALSKTGRQCIVETHSEYLVNRLRLRVSESDWGSGLKEEIGIMFVELRNGESRFKNIEINDYGAIPDWPDGFFDQGPSESDRILRSAQQKRKNRPTQS